MHFKRVLYLGLKKLSRKINLIQRSHRTKQKMKKSVKSILFVAFTFAISLHLFSQGVSSKKDEKTELIGFVDADDKWVIKPQYKEIDFDFGFKESPLFWVKNKSNKVGFINESGKEVVPCKYDEASSFEKGYSIIKIKVSDFVSKHGLIDSTGKEVISPSYGRLEYYPVDKVLVAGKEATSELGLLDMNGKVLIPFQYEFWSKSISKGIWPVGKNNISGVVNLKNEIIVPFSYEMIESYSNDANLASAKKGGKHGAINRRGEVVIPFIYDDTWVTGEYIAVKKDGKWGLVDASNKSVLPIEYFSISSASKTAVWASKSEKESEYEIDLVTKKPKVKNN